MQQTELNKLLAASLAEFDRRLRAARLRINLAEVQGFHSDPVESEADPEIEAEVA